MRIPPFLWALYHWLRVTVRVVLWVFFRRHTVIGRERLRDVGGPIIVVANHPSTLMDVLIPGTYIPRVLFFLANYGLFKHPVSGWLLRRLYCIPVKRKEDVDEGEIRNNEDAFEQSYIHLGKGGALFIAAEGNSWMNRFVRPLKTGAARIALGTEARYHNGVRILPIGLSYNAANLFRSEAVMQVGEPIVVADWLERWKQNGPATVEALTEHLENELKSLTVHTEDEAGEAFVGSVEAMMHRSAPLDLAAKHKRTQAFTRAYLHDPVKRQAWATYEAALKMHHTTDGAVAAKHSLWQPFALALGLPFALAAAVIWAFPLFVPYWVNRRMNLYIGYSSTVKSLVGLVFSFPIWLWALRVLSKPFAPGWLAYAGLLFLVVVLGLFAERYLDYWAAMRDRRQQGRLPKNVLAELEVLRAKVV